MNKLYRILDGNVKKHVVVDLSYFLNYIRHSRISEIVIKSQ